MGTHRLALAAARHWHPSQVVIIGAGPIGLLAAMLGRQRGLDVVVFDQVTDGPKPGLVADLGATYRTGSISDACATADIVIECTGVSSLVLEVLGRTAPDGIVCLTGVSSGGRQLTIDAGQVNRAMVLGNDVVFGSVNANRRHYEAAAEALAQADRVVARPPDHPTRAASSVGRTRSRDEPMTSNRSSSSSKGTERCASTNARLRLYFDDQFVVCAPDLQMSRHQGEGYVVADTRLASGYRIRIAGVEPSLARPRSGRRRTRRVSSSRIPCSMRRAESSTANTLHLRVDRSLGHGVHDDYDLTNFGAETVEVVLEISVECDFADVFDMKDHRLVRRGSLQTTWAEADVNADDPLPQRVIHTCARARGGSQRCRARVCQRRHLVPRPGRAVRVVAYLPLMDPRDRRRGAETSGAAVPRPARYRHYRRSRAPRMGGGSRLRSRRRIQASTKRSPDRSRISQACASTSSTTSRGSEPDTDGDESSDGIDTDVWVPAAGVPWFVTLFGRDSLLVSLQTLALSGRFAEGTLRALASQQATGYDPERDMEPGKIIHEIRHGELAQLHLIPHTPYYGTHDATTLFVLAAANAWRWHGRRDQLDALRPAVEAALGVDRPRRRP